MDGRRMFYVGLGCITGFLVQYVFNACTGFSPQAQTCSVHTQDFLSLLNHVLSMHRIFSLCSKCYFLKIKNFNLEYLCRSGTLTSSFWRQQNCTTRKRRTSWTTRTTKTDAARKSDPMTRKSVKFSHVL